MLRPWTPEAILEMARGFQPACVLAAAADLDVFDLLRDQPLCAEEIADRLESNSRGVTILLDALTALGVLDKQEGRYALPPGADEFLTSTGRRSVLAMLQHQANCLRRWAELGRVIKTGRPADRTPSIRGEAADLAAFIGAMDNIGAPIAAQVVSDVGPPPFSHLLDIGGASGTWTITFLRARPAAGATIFDLPPVIPMAEQRIRDAGLKDRVRFAAGDFERDALPPGADLAWVSAIIHQNSRTQNRRLYGAVFEALVPGGRILVRDLIMKPSRTDPVAGALFAVNMLVGTPAGGTYTFEETREDLLAAGFSDVQVLRATEGMDSVIGAKKQE